MNRRDLQLLSSATAEIMQKHPDLKKHPNLPINVLLTEVLALVEHFQFLDRIETDRCNCCNYRPA